MKIILYILFWNIAVSSCNSQVAEKLVYESENLQVFQLTKNTFRHVSYLQTESFGKVACNGMIFRNGKEAAVFDAPSTDSVSQELLDFISKDLESKTIALIANHHHIDCIGGMKAFYDKNIDTYITATGAREAKKDGYSIPFKTFEKKLELKVGEEIVINEYFGQAHTIDNIVSYIPSENIMFGGCMVKSIGAGKGNLADADVKEWPDTITKIKQAFPHVEYIIPGHGKGGSIELLNFTIELFTN